MRHPIAAGALAASLLGACVPRTRAEVLARDIFVPETVELRDDVPLVTARLLDYGHRCMTFEITMGVYTHDSATSQRYHHDITIPFRTEMVELDKDRVEFTAYKKNSIFFAADISKTATGPRARIYLHHWLEPYRYTLLAALRGEGDLCFQTMFIAGEVPPQGPEGQAADEEGGRHESGATRP